MLLKNKSWNFVTGAFLITYGIAMLFCGIPIFFQEVAIGQYLGAGGMSLVGQLCPLLQGKHYMLILSNQDCNIAIVIVVFQVWDMQP